MSLAKRRVMSSNHAGLVLHNMKQLCYLATLRSIPHHVTCMTSSSVSDEGHVLLGTHENGCLIYSMTGPDDGFVGRLGSQPSLKNTGSSKTSPEGTTIHSLTATDDSLVYIKEEKGLVSLCIHKLDDALKCENEPIVSTKLARPAPLVVEPKLGLVVVGAAAWKDNWTTTAPAEPKQTKNTDTKPSNRPGSHGNGSKTPNSAKGVKNTNTKPGSGKSGGASARGTKSTPRTDVNKNRPASSNTASNKQNTAASNTPSHLASNTPNNVDSNAHNSAFIGNEEKWLRVLDIADLAIIREFPVVQNSVSLLRVQVTEEHSMLGVTDSRTGLKVFDLKQPTPDGTYVCLYNVPIEEVRNFELVGDFIGVFHKFEPNVSFWNMTEQKTILCINIQDQMKQLALDYFQDEEEDGDGDSGLFDTDDDQVTAVCAVMFHNDHILIYGTRSGCIFGMSVESRTKLFSIPFPHDCDGNDQRVRKDVLALDLIHGDKLVACFQGHGLTILDFGKRDAPHRPPTRGQQK